MAPPVTRRTRRLITLLVATVLLVALGAGAFANCSGDDGESAPAPDEQTTTTTAPPVVDDLSAPLADPAATGRELAQRFLDILGNPTPAPLLDEFLSPAFQLQRANGTFANKEEYLEQPASVARFTILEEGFRAYQDGPALTVRFKVTIEEQIDGAELRVTDAERLGVFLRTSRGWQLVAWSNFNPVAPAS